MFDITWQSFKARLISTSVYPSWIEQDDNYVLWSHIDFPLICTIVKTTPPNADQIDFESTYKTEGAGKESNVVLSGLSTGLSTTAIVVTDSPTLIPATASVLENRNGISIRNITNETIYFGSSAVTPETGYPKFQNEEFIADIRDSAAVYIYGVCQTGATAEVRIMQLA